MPWQLPFGEESHRSISGLFRYGDDRGNTLTFNWDGAAVRDDGTVVLVEAETTAPVVLHVQGHVARAAYMVRKGTPVSKLVWLVPNHHFPALWGIVEPWRTALAEVGFASPPCEYRTPDGVALAVSP